MALDWFQPLQQPLPVPPSPIDTFIWSPFALSGTDTILTGWYRNFPPPLPLNWLSLQTQQASPITLTPPVSIVPSMASWFRPLASPLPPPLPLYPKTSTGPSFGVSQVEAVHIQWWRQFASLLPPGPPPISRFTWGMLPVSAVISVTLNAATGVFKLSGGPAVLRTTPEPFPAFQWDVTYSFSRLVSPFVQVVAYEPIQQIMLVVFQDGSGTTYSPASVGAVNTTLTLVKSGQNPASFLATLPVLD